MRKLKLYLDTSVISYIEAPHKPKEEEATWRFFRFIDEHFDEYELLISPVVENEIENCPEPKCSRLKEFLFDLAPTVLLVSPQAENLATVYEQHGVLGAQHHNDLLHIAYAVLADCDFIVSWNFKHFVNNKTPVRVNAVNAKYKYRSLTILSPTVLQEALTHDDT